MSFKFETFRNCIVAFSRTLLIVSVSHLWVDLSRRGALRAPLPHHRQQQQDERPDLGCHHQSRRKQLEEEKTGRREKSNRQIFLERSEQTGPRCQNIIGASTNATFRITSVRATGVSSRSATLTYLENKNGKSLSSLCILLRVYRRCWTQEVSIFFLWPAPLIVESLNRLPPGVAAVLLFLSHSAGLFWSLLLSSALLLSRRCRRGILILAVQKKAPKLPLQSQRRPPQPTWWPTTKISSFRLCISDCHWKTLFWLLSDSFYVKIKSKNVAGCAVWQHIEP